MHRVQKNDVPAHSARWRMPRLPLLLAALASAGAALAQQLASPNAADSSHAAKKTSYRVINLGSTLLASIPDINAKGQVSFSTQTDSGAVAGYFYNGATVQDIGTLGGSEVLANDLNDVGQIAGLSTNGAGAEHAFVWSAAGGMLDLGVLPGASESSAVAINNRGVVTGTSDGVPLTPPRAFRWSPATGMESLGAFTSGLVSMSFSGALNDAGLIAGESATETGDRQAFAWTRSGGLVNIDTLHSVDALVVAVGARGEVAGNRIASLDSPFYHPFLWTPATGMVDLGTAGGTEAFVLAMSPRLHIAGLIDLPDGNQRAMSWTRATGIRNLGTLGGASSRAIDVNDKGQIVGFAANKAGDSRAFVWTAKTGLQDLNKVLHHAPPGLVLDDALSINDSGAIVATSNAGLVLLKPVNGHGCGCGHALGPIVAPALVKAGAPLQASVDFVDEDQAGTRSVSWSWGDGSAAQAAKLSGSAGAGKASASHSFAAPGIYTVTATVVDGGGRSTAVSRKVVVSAASGGMVAGAGAVMSPRGAFGKTPSYVGKASFSLIAPLGTNMSTSASTSTSTSTSTSAGAGAASTPAGLHFDLPGLSFRSQDLRFLGRQDAQLVFVGSGTVRGAGGYQFRLSTSAAAITAESGQGSFALKIWHTDATSKAQVVDYDNTQATAGSAGVRMTEGSIVVE
jgi:probable HAF family extracellular repeat protein